MTTSAVVPKFGSSYPATQPVQPSFSKNTSAKFGDSAASAPSTSVGAGSANSVPVLPGSEWQTASGQPRADPALPLPQLPAQLRACSEPSVAPVPLQAPMSEAALRKREKELDERERRLREREQEAGLGQKNWPICSPFMRHSIAEDIPEKSRRVVREAYACWWVSDVLRESGCSNAVVKASCALCTHRRRSTWNEARLALESCVWVRPCVFVARRVSCLP